MPADSNISPSSGKKAASRQSAPNRFLIDVGVIPAIRPAMSSDRARLTYKVGRPEAAFIPEGRAVDAALSLSGSHVNAVINESPPNKERITGRGSQHDSFPRADELGSLSSISIVICRVVAFIQSQARCVAVFC